MHMKSRILSALLGAIVILPAGTLSAQSADTALPSRKIYLLRPNEYVGALVKIKIDVNGRTISLPNNSFAVLDVQADSVILKIDNKRVSGESIQPLVTYKPVSYFVAIPEEHAHKKDRLILAEVEKDRYDLYAQKVSHQVQPAQHK